MNAPPSAGVDASSGRRPVAVDLFCGAGGMSLGFERAGFDVLVAIDNDPVHLAVHKRNFPHTEVVCADIASLSGEEVQRATTRALERFQPTTQWDGIIDCIFGGPSCQGFSDMGRQRDDDERNELVFSFARLVDELRPRSFVIENVPGLLFTKQEERLTRLLKVLRQAGYQLTEDGPATLNAADYGVPQLRRRVFIVGVKGDLPVPALPSPSGRVTVAEALDDLPPIEEFESLLTTSNLTLTTDRRTALDEGSAYSQSLRTNLGFEYPRSWDRNVLTGCGRTVHSSAVVERFKALEQGAKDGPSRTSRLRGDGQSQTLRAGTGPDHGSFTAPRPVHHAQPRVISVREAARLHSYPDWFDFHTTKWHALREIGNSVPPNLAAAVAAEIVTSLDYQPVTPRSSLQLGAPGLLEFSLQTAASHFNFERNLLPPDVRRSKHLNLRKDAP